MVVSLETRTVVPSVLVLSLAVCKIVVPDVVSVSAVDPGVFVLNVVINVVGVLSKSVVAVDVPVLVLSSAVD